MNGDQRDYWKEKYARDVLGKPPPKEYVVDGFVKASDLAKDFLNLIKDNFL